MTNTDANPPENLYGICIADVIGFSESLRIASVDAETKILGYIVAALHFADVFPGCVTAEQRTHLETLEQVVRPMLVKIAALESERYSYKQAAEFGGVRH